MKLCNIVPQCLQKDVVNDFEFVEAAWCSYRLYWDSFVECHNKKEIVLDNSTHLLGRPMPGEYISTLAYRLSQRGWEDITVVAPDVKCDCEQTIALSKAFFEGISLPGDVRVMIVPQGRNLEEWKKCLSVLQNFSRSQKTTIGIPFQTVFPDPAHGVWGKNRLALVEHVTKTIAPERVHLLGLSTPYELRYYAALSINGTKLYNDSSAAYTFARDNIRLGESNWNREKGRMVDVTAPPLGQDGMSKFIHNMCVMRLWSGGAV